MAKRRAVITGMGTVNPLAHDVETFWGRLLAGESGIRPIARFDASDYTSRIGGEVTDWVGLCEPHVHKRELKRFDEFAKYAMGAAIEAVENSRIDFEAADKDGCGVLIGSGVGGLQTLETQHEIMMARGPKRV